MIQRRYQNFIILFNLYKSITHFALKILVFWLSKIDLGSPVEPEVKHIKK